MTISPSQAALDDRISVLADIAEMQDSPAHTAFLEIQSIHAAALDHADPQARADLDRQNAALTQDYTADLAILAGAQFETQGQHEDAQAMQLEAEARREIAEGLRNPPTTPQGSPDAGPQDSTFGDDAARAAMAFGFGASAKTIFMYSTNEGHTMHDNDAQGAFDERASFMPGGQDYAVLRAETPAIQDEQGGDWFAESVKAADATAAQAAALEEEQKRGAAIDISEPERPNDIANATMTIGVGIAPAPGGSVLYTYQQALNGPDIDTVSNAGEFLPSHPDAAQAVALEQAADAQTARESAAVEAGTNAAFLDTGSASAEPARTSVENDWFAASVEAADATAAQAGQEQDTGRGASMGAGLGA